MPGDMSDQIQAQILIIRPKLAEAVRLYFNLEYSEGLQVAILFVVNDTLDADLVFSGEIDHVLENIRKSFSRRDYAAIVEIGNAVYIDRKISEIENPSVKDMAVFARAVGMAEGAIIQALHFREKRRRGGEGRAKKIADAECLVMEKVKGVDGWESKSADDLAGDVLGMKGINFSHRKIADTIRAYRKKQRA